MSRRPAVSVIIPCYNRAGIVTRAIESALAQDYRPLEIVVVDDGSSDDSVAVASRYATAATLRQAQDAGSVGGAQDVGSVGGAQDVGSVGGVQHDAPVVKVIVHEHLGPPGIRNVGVEASAGDYIAFLDADDVWTENSLSRRMELLDKADDIDLVFGDAGVLDAGSGAFTERYLDGRTELTDMETARLGEDAYLVVSDPLPYLLRRSFVLTSTAIVSRSAWDRIGGFDESLLFAEDFDLWLRIAEHGRFAYVTAVTALYDRQEDSMTRKRRFVAFGLVKVWTKLLSRYARRYPELHRLLATNLGSFSYEAGKIAVEERNPALARQCFGTAIRCLPTFKSAWVGYLKTLFSQ